MKIWYDFSLKRVLKKINPDVFVSPDAITSLTTDINSEDLNFEGSWKLSLQDGARTLIGILEIEKQGSTWKGYLEGGPVEIIVDTNEIEIIADSRDVRGFIFNRRLKGKIVNDQMSGSYRQEGAAAQKEKPGTWKAKRDSSVMSKSLLPNPQDISGIWTATQELDFRKYTMIKF